MSTFDIFKKLTAFAKGKSNQTRISIQQTVFGQKDMKIISVDADNLPLSLEYQDECFMLGDVIHNSEIPDKDIILLYHTTDKYFKIERNDLMWRTYS